MEPVQTDDVPNFLNEFFANIANRTRLFDPDSIDRNSFEKNVDSEFHFEPPNIFELKELIKQVDTSMSSCIEGINARTCKTVLECIPEQFLKLFANSLFTGIFPEKWTCASLTFLPKEGNKTNPTNWRPISQTNLFLKMLEKIVHASLLKYLLDNNLISKYQFGFLPCKSTHQAVFNVIKHMYGSMNNNKVIGAIYLDIAKAFNCISQELLFMKMVRAGFTSNVINWFRSYLNRYQTVRIKDKVSDNISVPAGIAQGTVLGPLLFVFYINDVISCLNHVNISMFADDCVLYISGNNWNNIRPMLQLDLDAFALWCRNNALSLNISKTKTMIFGNRHKITKIRDPLPLYVQLQNLQFVKKYTYLGITLDSEITLEPYYKSIIKKVNNKIYTFRKIRKYISFDIAVQIYKQTIFPFFLLWWLYMYIIY